MARLKSLIIFSVVFILISSTLHAAEYVAFSMKVAKERIISTPKEEDFRKVHPEVFTLGGITAIRGLVYDRKTEDVILVGERDINRAVLTLDDFVVALRARFIHGKWPLVSIDPTPDTEKTNMQIVRFEGGIEDTQFGEDLFNADYRLKKIGLGLISPGVEGVKTYWDLSMDEAKQGINKKWWKGSRFWFYPMLPNVSVREDVVAIKGLKVAVFTKVEAAEMDGKKVENPSTFQDIAGDKFAKMVSDSFEKLGSVHPPFHKLQGLNELVALTKAIEEMVEKKPDLGWWLKVYKIKEEKTSKEVEELKRGEEYELQGELYRRYLWLEGGVQLMAIALSLKAGDVTALKEAVFKTRPKQDALSWSFIVGEWLIPTSIGMLKIEDIVPLFTQAEFLHEQKRYDDAITLYGKIIELKPDWDWAYNNRGLVSIDKGLYEQAIKDFDKALEINPRLAEAFVNRGSAYTDKGQYDQAIGDFNKTIEINPQLVEAYNNRGNAYSKKGEYNKAIFNYNKALEINLRYANAYYNRGRNYSEQGLYNQAILDFTKAIELNPRYAEAYGSRGNAFAVGKQDYDNAISDYNHAIEINPWGATTYNNRGSAYAQGKGDYDRAILDYNKALEINPRDADAYNNRGFAYVFKGFYDQAISDSNKAIEINPGLAIAYYTRGLAYGKKGLHNQAILDFTNAIELNPKDAAAYDARGVAYIYRGVASTILEDIRKACSDWKRACELGSCGNKGKSFCE